MKRCKLLMVLSVVALLALAAGCERKVVNENDDSAELAACFTCHADNDSRLIQAKAEWANSVHASGDNVDYTNRANNPCARCHQHQGFVDFITTGQIHPPYESAAPIHCFTCHAPHTTGTLHLRTEAPVTLANGAVFNHEAANLCANCHSALMSANIIMDNIMLTSNRWGPHHGTQADLVSGTNGYEIDGYDYDNTGHASAVEEACVGCHMANVEAHDGTKIGGHSFNMTDEESGSNLAEYCTECHPEAEDFNYENIQIDTESRLAQLQALLLSAGVLADFNGELLPNVPRGDTLIIADGNIAGALFNYLLIEDDRSEGVHNPDYITDLLESSIAYLESVVPLRVSPRSGPEPIAAH